MLGQQFVVTAVKGGQRTVALFALGGAGAGGVTVLGRAHAAEPNDVLVSIGVPVVAQIRRAATGFFGPWKPGTVLVDGQEPATAYAGAFLVTDRVHLAAPGNPAAESGVHVVMGGVGYRVSETRLGIGSLTARRASFVDLDRSAGLIHSTADPLASSQKLLSQGLTHPRCMNTLTGIR
jgi:hypothetical protein